MKQEIPRCDLCGKKLSEGLFTLPVYDSDSILNSNGFRKKKMHLCQDCQAELAAKAREIKAEKNKPEKPELKKLRETVDKIINHHSAPLYVIHDLQDAYDTLAHHGTHRTICSETRKVLQDCGFKPKPDGIGWKVS